MIKAFKGTIQGRVQGVGYRNFAQHTAMEFQINGWVRNLPDGSVEIMAIGEPADLEALLLKLKTGPLMGRVSSIDIDWLKEIPKIRDFEITG